MNGPLQSPWLWGKPPPTHKSGKQGGVTHPPHFKPLWKPFEIIKVQSSNHFTWIHMANPLPTYPLQPCSQVWHCHWVALCLVWHEAGSLHLSTYAPGNAWCMYCSTCFWFKPTNKWHNSFKLSNTTVFHHIGSLTMDMSNLIKTSAYSFFSMIWLTSSECESLPLRL